MCNYVNLALLLIRRLSFYQIYQQIRFLIFLLKGIGTATMPLPLTLSFQDKCSTGEISARCLVSEAKQKMQNPSFGLDFGHMKIRYTQFMKEHKDKMNNFSWDQKRELQVHYIIFQY